MSQATSPISTAEVLLPATAGDLWSLLKPRVISLVVFTGAVGLIAAPGSMDPVLALAAVLCIALGAGGSAALNQWHEADTDALMRRTASRPLPAGRMEPATALQLGIGLSVASVAFLGLVANWLAALILAISVVYYAVAYTMWLKPRTPQNIVIGGGAGAFPPLIGWVAATGEVSALPLLLFAIIFFWTPPHFWALSLFMKSDYAAAGIPMLPVVRGERVTRRHIGVYTVVLTLVALAPLGAGPYRSYLRCGGRVAVRGLRGRGLAGGVAGHQSRRSDEAGEAAVRLLHPVPLHPVRCRRRRRGVRVSGEDHVGRPPERLSPEQTELWRKRQKDRAVWMALILGGLAVLIFFVAWRKMLAG